MTSWGRVTRVSARGRRRRRAGALTAAVAAVLLPLAASAPVGAADPQLDTALPPLLDERPNVVMMLVDDMRLDDLAYMPTTRRLLGERGVRFSNAVSVNPVCCPARASLVTAQYSHNNGVYSNGGLFGGVHALRDPDDTLPVWLQRAGYATAFFGRYMNGYRDTDDDPIPAGWDWWDALGVGVWSYTDFQMAGNGDSEWFEDDYVTTRQRQRSDVLIESFARRREATGLPFFVFDSYVAPHGSLNPAPEMEARFGRNPIPEPKHRDTWSDVVAPSLRSPAFNERVRHDVHRDGIGRFRAREADNIQRTFTARIQTLASVDDAVAQTVRTLEATGQYDDTVLVFTSDNGFVLGENGRYAKVVPQRHSIRVPLLIAGPGFERGVTSRRWATTPDVAATIADLAGAGRFARRTPDGRSLVGAGAADDRPRTGLLIESGHGDARSTREPRLIYQGLLVGTRYTFVRWRHGRRPEELYDNRLDPHQLVNRARDVRYRAVVRAARAEVARLRTCSGVGACESERRTWPAPEVRAPR